MIDMYCDWVQGLVPLLEVISAGYEVQHSTSGPDGNDMSSASKCKYSYCE